MTGAPLIRAMIRMLAVIVAGSASIMGGAWLGTGEAHACSCVQWAPIEAVKHADAIVVGRATSDRVVGNDRIYEFDVETSYKTRVPQHIQISTPSQSPSCGMDLPIGERTTVVLTDGTEDSPLPFPPTTQWSTTLCSNLAEMSPMPSEAGAPMTPVTASRDADQPFTRSGVKIAGWGLAGVAVIVGGVLLAIRRRRRTGS